MDANSSVVWFGHLLSCVVVLAGSCLMALWDWFSYVQVMASWLENQCSHGLKTRPLESCHYQCLKAVCGVLVYPKGAAAELLDGTLKLRHCTEVFTVRFSPWCLPRVGNGSGKRQSVTPGHPTDDGDNRVKRVRAYQEDTSRCFFS